MQGRGTYMNKPRKGAKKESRSAWWRTDITLSLLLRVPDAFISKKMKHIRQKSMTYPNTSGVWGKNVNIRSVY